jgi:hypothetical protein
MCVISHDHLRDFVIYHALNRMCDGQKFTLPQSHTSERDIGASNVPCTRSDVVPTSKIPFLAFVGDCHRYHSLRSLASFSLALRSALQRDVLRDGNILIVIRLTN